MMGSVGLMMPPDEGGLGTEGATPGETGGTPGETGGTTGGTVGVTPEVVTG